MPNSRRLRKAKRPWQDEIRALRTAVIARDGNRCFYCDDPFASTLDHIEPHAHGGGWEVDNLVIACQVCNSRRGTLPADVFLRIVKSEQARAKAVGPLNKMPRRAKAGFQRKHPWLGRNYCGPSGKNIA